MLPRPFLDGPRALASIHALPFSPVGFSGDTALERSPLYVMILLSKFIIFSFLYCMLINGN